MWQLSRPQDGADMEKNKPRLKKMAGPQMVNV